MHSREVWRLPKDARGEPYSSLWDFFECELGLTYHQVERYLFDGDLYALYGEEGGKEHRKYRLRKLVDQWGLVVRESDDCFGLMDWGEDDDLFPVFGMKDGRPIADLDEVEDYLRKLGALVNG
jgi:hypothetical protein